MPENYLWLAAPGDADLLIRKSRFLGFARPIATAADAGRALAELRRRHPRATHHVHAWRIYDAHTGQISHRFDDDGEPGGTAGRPVLQVLEAQRVVNATVVVVRYFGGIKLGAGGLMRAYGEATARALEQARREPLIPRQRLIVGVPFAQLSAIEHLAARRGVPISERRYAARAELTLDVPCSEIEEFIRAARDLTGGTAHFG